MTLESNKPKPLKVYVPVPTIPCTLCGKEGAFYNPESVVVYCHEHVHKEEIKAWRSATNK